MPLKHQPSCLRTAALSTIAKHFELICYGSKMTEDMAALLNTDEYLSVEGPFTQMPASILQDMMEAVTSVKSLHKKHLHILIQSQLDTLDLSYGTGADSNHGFIFLKSRCKNLRRLNISYLRHMSPNTLLTLLPCFTNLVSLNMQMTLTVDQILGEIGKRCESLVDLNLSMTPITDRGLVQLCVASDGRRLCQKLVRLVVNETYITTAGAIVVLQSLPNLREFDFERIFEALEQVSNWSHELEMRLLCGAGVRLNATTSPPPESLRLTTLISTADFVRTEGLEAAARLCVDARSLTMSNAWVASEALYKFMVMDHLTSLSLTNCEGLTIDFHEGVLPLLAVCGSRLENLILTNFIAVDITSIGKACIPLKNLALSNIASYEYSGVPSPEMFTNLLALELWSDPHADLQPNMIRQLTIFSPSIKNLLFKGCQVLTDKLLADIWRVNPMQKLSHLTLDYCHAVSATSLNYLLDATNQLTVLRVWNCLNIMKIDNIQLCRRITSENLDLYLEWFQYDE